MNKNVRITLTLIYEYIGLFVGAFIIAISFSAYLLPNNIASGGITGLSVILHQLLGFNVAYIQWAINVPLCLWGIARRGLNFGIKTALGSWAIPAFILFFQHFSFPDAGLLKASLLGGIGLGAGIALVYMCRGSVGGFSLVAHLLHDYTNLRVSHLLMILNGFVLAFACFTFDIYLGLYAFLSLVAMSFSVDAFYCVVRLAQRIAENGWCFFMNRS